MTWGRRLLVGCLVFGLSFVLGFSEVASLPTLEVKWNSTPDHSYTPRFDARGGPELALVYIGASRCAAANREDLPETIKQLKLLIQEKAETNNRNFVAIGIARDWIVNAGVKHLKKFGTFDEIMTGRNWLNIGTLKYLYEDIPGLAATPQVLVVDRVVDGLEAPAYSIRNEVLMVRKTGPKRIQQWLEQGAPMPTLKPVTAAAE